MRPGNNEWLDVSEQVKRFYGTGDCIRHDFSGQMRDIHTVTGVTLAVEDIGCDSTELRHTLIGTPIALTR